MKTNSSPFEDFDAKDVIKLQLKKPKRWNWELTTSKSAPNIQLFDSKGKLLVDTEKKDRNSWNSCDFDKRRKPKPIQKSKSDIIDVRGNATKIKGVPYKPLDRYRINLDAKLDPNPKFTSLLENQKSKYKRSSTDDLYDKILKYNREFNLRSSNESIKRAVEDGYDSFINPQVLKRPDFLDDSNNEKESKKPILKPNKESVKNLQVNTNSCKKETNRVKHSKYITRTCSAGTLVIKEESFSNPNLRRRKKTNEENFKYNLFHTKSDVFPFRRLSPNNGKTKSSSSNSSSSDSTNSRVIKDYGRRRASGARPRLAAGLADDDGGDDRANNNSSGGANDNAAAGAAAMGANVSRHHHHRAAKASSAAAGLSGRRTQSSGSICGAAAGAKGSSAAAAVDAAATPAAGGSASAPKLCGSLPGYLDGDDGDVAAAAAAASARNNNAPRGILCRGGDKREEERIPPLGDGAPLHWKFSDTQTALCDQGYGSERSPEEEYPPPLPEHDNQCHHHLDLHSCYPFITPESTFTVSLSKGSRGLGLSVTGGVDSGGSWPGLIRVKRLFPHQPAAACEMLNVGDLILEVNGITLTGLTNYEALEVLRTSPNQVELKMCRPPPDVLSCVSPISEVPPPPPRREPPTSLNLVPCSEEEQCHGEFEITMRKLQGSLGFTLRKEDDSALGHYIRALVREPALTDGRIKAGDKIIAVDDVEISPMTHEEAVQFLRRSGELVKLRLYRDLAQTPVATLSPTETTPRTSFSKKTQLRQEAVDMLNDIAVRKLIPGNQEFVRRSLSPNSSPRKLRGRPACPSDASNNSDSSSRQLITDEVFHEGLLKKCSLPLDEDSFNSLFIEDDDSDKPSRPSSLDLYNPNQTPVASRKPKFNFSLAHNAYELNNLDAEILDAPNLNYNADEANSTEVECGEGFPQEPASMPHIPAPEPSGFSHKHPAYQSAQTIPENAAKAAGKPAQEDGSNMKKWKGVVFTADEERERQKVLKKEGYGRDENDYEILAIELNRGWNSRLGFSLQGAASVTYVSAVHADSVAAKDGRIKPGDRLIKVNDENVENMTTSEIIDLLRIVRGPVCIIVSRPKNN